MKTTVKEFLAKSEYKKELSRQADSGDANLYEKCTTEIKKIKSEYFDKIDTVNVSYSIGARNYYTNVYKIGNSYFLYGRKMTKSNGYHNICEIDKITDKMTNEMIEDSYYY